jgi:Zn-dependent protease with chaperone function
MNAHRLLETGLLALLLLVAVGLPPAGARTPRNSAKLPQEHEVWTPTPRRYWGGQGRIPIFKDPGTRAWVSTIFTRVASAANLKVMPGLSDEEQREADRRAESNIPDDEQPETGKKGEKGKRPRKTGGTITILDWDVVNAFATPGEKLYVTTALLQVVESDDELASVIGHEIAHVRLNHIEKRMKRQMISSLLFALATFQGGGDAFMGGQMMSQIPVLPYSQKQELEADRIGMSYTKAAGYDPNGSIGFLEKLAAHNKDEDKAKGFASMFSTHPATPRRIEDARRLLAELGVPPGKTSHLSFDFKLQRLSVDLTKLDLNKLSGKASQPVTGPDAPHGHVITSMRIKGNLLPDGDFEATPKGQTLPAGWSIVTGEARVDGEAPESGRQSLKLTPDGPSGVGEVMGGWVALDPQQDYVFSGHLRAGDRRLRASLGLRYFDASRKLLTTDYPAAWKVFPPAEWTRYQGTVFSRGNQFSLPPQARWARVVLLVTCVKPAPCWLDELILVKVWK